MDEPAGERRDAERTPRAGGAADARDARPDAPRICVVVPCFEEEAGIEAFYAATKQVLRESCGACAHELVFVDDGSRDGTLARLNALAAADETVTVCSFARNFGHQAALSAGIELADADAVILMDSDLQHPPALIPEMLRLWRAGNDVVVAVRRSTRGASAFKRLSSDGFYVLFNRLSETRIAPGAADFCLLSRRAADALRRMPERHRFLRGMIAWTGFPQAQISYEAASRVAGDSKYTLRKMLVLALDALFAFTGEPVRLAVRLGLAVTSLGLLYLVYILVHTLVVGDTDKGWPSLISTVLVLGGLQLISIGLVGEYLVRVYEETKGRPLYVYKQPPPRRARSDKGAGAEPARSAGE